MVYVIYKCNFNASKTLMKLIIATTLLFSTAATLAQQGSAPYPGSSESDGDWATVRRVEPLVEQVSAPQRVCEQGSMAVAQPQGNPGGAVLGAVVGGVLGNQVGHGRGRAAATAAGVAIGAGVGYGYGPQDTVVTQVPTTECRTVAGYSQRTAGYRVTYEYDGREYQSVMARPPGERIRVSVSVVPTEESYRGRRDGGSAAYGPAPVGYQPASNYPPIR